MRRRLKKDFEDDFVKDTKNAAAEVADKPGGVSKEGKDLMMSLALRNAECIASDDPRLAK